VTAYGIDLGTSYSCVAKVDDTGRAVVLKNAIDEYTTPSVVYFESANSVVVGQDAKDAALIFPELVASQVMRQMGDSNVHWEFHGVEHTPVSVSALILRELTRAAAEECGERVRDVVITVPAYFGIAAREATRQAGQLAGLEVLDILAEPVAAALHYQAVNDTGTTRHLLVYYLGYAFDATVIRLSGDDVEVVCTDGDHQLGGPDWDAKVVEYMLEAFAARQPDIDPSADEQFMQDVVFSAEKLKKDLSETQSSRVLLRLAGHVVPVELTRSRLQELTEVLLEHTMAVTSRTIETAREKGVAGLDGVLLVGGMTRMPVVVDTLRERFGLESKLHEPDLAVAKGAALFALVKQVRLAMPAYASPGDAPGAARQVADQLGLSVEQVENLAARRVATVVPRAFGIKVIDSDDPLARTNPARARGMILHLLNANTPLPADSGPQIFGTVTDDQREVRLEVWEQAKSIASRDIADNTHIASVLLTDLPPRPAGTTFEVTFYMTETGLLTVYAVESESRREVRFEIQVSGLTDDEARTAGEALAHYWVSERATVSVRSEPGWVERVHWEDETTNFDVFLCHNVADKPAVRWTAERLRERGILPWLDETELQPGRPWQEELERQIGRIGAAAVFVGPNGVGPWQNQEMMAFLREFVERRCPVIPVLLPGATAPALPLLLRGMTWVDLRIQDLAAIDRLIWGITGRKPQRRG
jgi:molecular chaperone DnaK (HSP70)